MSVIGLWSIQHVFDLDNSSSTPIFLPFQEALSQSTETWRTRALDLLLGHSGGSMLKLGHFTLELGHVAVLPNPSSLTLLRNFLLFARDHVKTAWT